jgi:hypothetical protein
MGLKTVPDFFWWSMRKGPAFLLLLHPFLLLSLFVID